MCAEQNPEQGQEPTCPQPSQEAVRCPPATPGCEGLIWDLGEDVPSLFSSVSRDCLARLPWGDQGTHGVIPGVHGLCGVRLHPCPCSMISSPTSSHSSWGIWGRRIRGPLGTLDVLTCTFKFPSGHKGRGAQFRQSRDNDRGPLRTPCSYPWAPRAPCAHGRPPSGSAESPPADLPGNSSRPEGARPGPQPGPSSHSPRRLCQLRAWHRF